ncbi:MAG: DNA recombination protein RmuC [Nitrospirota bacterium]|nr:MAG: DNA recombination protein RmuC [Nitrospirota bacterium]
MPEWSLIILGLVIVAVIGWLVGHVRGKTTTAAAESRSQELRLQLESVQSQFDQFREQFREMEVKKIAAETKIMEAEKNLAAQQTLLEEAKTTLSDTFKSLAAEALAGNNAGFLTLAEQKFKALKEEASSDLDQRKTSIEALIQPLSQTLTSYQKESKELEDKRIRELSSVGEQLRQLSSDQSTLRTETAKLVNALQKPQVRGRWGEITLRKTAELAGMSPHCDFIEQESVETETGRLRPDMVVKLPAAREVIVDSKVPLEAFLESLGAKTDEEREAALVRHAAQVKQHVNKLASKDYWEQFKSAPEFVVLFIPNDSFLSAAAEKDSSLIESAIGKNVVIATPTTFIALLRAIAYGWRQEQVAESAQRISALGQELSDRMATLADHLIKVGGSLAKAVESYNAAVASLESRILPSARKFKQLGAGSKKEIEELQVIEQQPREPTHPEKP